MSDYTQVNDYSAKDSLASGDPNKIIKGSDIDAEFSAISTAIATKANDSAVVHVTGDESVAGNKTFSGDVIMSSSMVQETEGAAVASAATCDIWTTDGNTKHITGTTTITSFGTAPQAGVWMRVIFDDALTLTHGANLNILNGGSNITTAAGDMAFVYADTTTQFDVLYFKASGQPLITPTAAQGASVVLISSQTASASSTLDFTGIDSTYDEILFVLVNVLPATNGVTLNMRAGTGGTPTYDTTGGNYRSALMGYNTAGTAANSLNTASGYMELASGADPISNTASSSTVGWCGNIRLMNPAGSTYAKGFLVQCHYSSTAGAINFLSGQTVYLSATAVTAVRFLCTSGSIASGTIYRYGLKKS